MIQKVEQDAETLLWQQQKTTSSRCVVWTGVFPNLTSNNEIYCFNLATVNPILLRGLWESEHDVVVHGTILAILVLVHDLLDKVAGKGNQKCLKRRYLYFYIIYDMQ